MVDREYVDDPDNLSDKEGLVCDLLGAYIERRVAGEPHHGISFLRIARTAGAEAERELAALMAFYEPGLGGERSSRVGAHPDRRRRAVTRACRLRRRDKHVDAGHRRGVGRG
jgi:hypothetical protein